MHCVSLKEHFIAHESLVSLSYVTKEKMIQIHDNMDTNKQIQSAHFDFIVI